MKTRGKFLILGISSVIAFFCLAGMFYNRVAAREDAYKELKVFVDILKRVDDDYVEKPDLSKAMEGAMKGMVEALDPYGAFLSREKLAAIEPRKDSAPAVIGVELSKRGGLAYVITTIPDGAAARAGIRAGDYIDAVDDKSVAESSVFEVEDKLRGEPGSQVSLSVIRTSVTEPLTIKVTRELPQYPPVEIKMLDAATGYIHIYHWAVGTSGQVREAIKQMTRSGGSKLVLDLRNSGGGDFTEALAAANLFINHGVLAYRKFHEGEPEPIAAKADADATSFPMVVLVDFTTAGPAEVIAGAILDSKRGELVGEKTFGFASKQKLFTLRNGSALVLSVEKFLTPSQKSIQDETPKLAGIKPTVVYPDARQKNNRLLDSYLDDADGRSEAYRKVMQQIEKEQLDKAIEVLNRPPEVKKAA
ncbi:MAG: PDZ domain-containing protein [Acidobacteria bacterium]|nr:PDZ domain-containing protein [Acidobacteriota bacterium]MBI3657673.1 PDZ domain-containing protein [Acidobacteriota bacterium]